MVFRSIVFLVFGEAGDSHGSAAVHCSCSCSRVERLAPPMSDGAGMTEEADCQEWLAADDRQAKANLVSTPEKVEASCEE